MTYLCGVWAGSQMPTLTSSRVSVAGFAVEGFGGHQIREARVVPYRSLIEALYTLNSPPVVSFN